MVLSTIIFLTIYYNKTIFSVFIHKFAVKYCCFKNKFSIEPYTAFDGIDRYGAAHQIIREYNYHSAAAFSYLWL